MLKFSQINSSKKAIIFELDDVLVPQKDYDLQVYYLFSNFIEYLETFPPAQEMLAFIKKRYEVHGNEGMFDEVANTFGIAEKFKENLALLFNNAKLPLKMLLYKEALDLLQELVVNRNDIYILTSGKPEQQLNKIKQTEWNGLDKYLKVYFADEFANELPNEALTYLMKENNLVADEVLIVGNSDDQKEKANLAGIDFLPIK
ncbi:HAD hydrolase-like protein [Pedobacter arcticus]|uniref:HAD hydrolase-like protein n=1 Tax=Pedobacter arcticus TaxID=752140 RepID=UPI0002DD38E7|nr:HAD hydrolase-like protein [Pedobacter arcticus]